MFESSKINVTSERENFKKLLYCSRVRKQQALSSEANAATITYDDVVECIKVCKSLNIKYMVSPYEADAQIAYLVESGAADFAISEDSDLLAYGYKEVCIQ